MSLSLPAIYYPGYPKSFKSGHLLDDEVSRSPRFFVMSHSPLQPPVPFADFEFTFDPSLSNLFPNPPPLPSSADLFSPSETTDLLGFLDNFNDFAWDFNVPTNDYLPEHLHLQPSYEHVSSSIAPYSNPHLNTIPDPSASNRPKQVNRPTSSRGAHLHQQQQQQQAQPLPQTLQPQPQQLQPQQLLPTSHEDTRSNGFRARAQSLARSTTSDSSTTNTTVFSASADPPARAAAAARTKPLLSTPQKRLNHIMSEQKRRNAIRDGYAQLITLMAPAGSAPGIGMPTRGRPKGSGSRGKGQTKGKSGVLFRAVEYCRWLEEGRDTLQQEVFRVETAAGLR